MTKAITKITASALVDIAAIFGIPGTSTLKEVWDQIVERKAEQARKILMEEVEDGDFSSVPEDEIVSIIHRYLQASINGTAKLNLRLLAQLIKGLTQNNENLEAGLYASKFNRYSNILADLSYEELQILATLYKFKTQNELESAMSGPQVKVSQYRSDERHYYDKAKDWLSGNSVNIKKGMGDIVQENGKKILHPEEFDAITASLVRTGLVYVPANYAFLSDGLDPYELTPLFFKLTELVEFQSIFQNDK